MLGFIVFEIPTFPARGKRLPGSRVKVAYYRPALVTGPALDLAGWASAYIALVEDPLVRDSFPRELAKMTGRWEQLMLEQLTKEPSSADQLSRRLFRLNQLRQRALDRGHTDLSHLVAKLIPKGQEVIGASHIEGLRYFTTLWYTENGLRVMAAVFGAEADLVQVAGLPHRELVAVFKGRNQAGGQAEGGQTSLRVEQFLCPDDSHLGKAEEQVLGWASQIGAVPSRVAADLRRYADKFLGRREHPYRGRGPTVSEEELMERLDNEHARRQSRREDGKGKRSLWFFRGMPTIDQWISEGHSI